MRTTLQRTAALEGFFYFPKNSLGNIPYGAVDVFIR